MHRGNNHASGSRPFKQQVHGKFNPKHLSQQRERIGKHDAQMHQEHQELLNQMLNLHRVNKDLFSESLSEENIRQEFLHIIHGNEQTRSHLYLARQKKKMQHAGISLTGSVLLLIMAASIVVGGAAAAQDQRAQDQQPCDDSVFKPHKYVATHVDVSRIRGLFKNSNVPDASRDAFEQSMLKLTTDDFKRLMFGFSQMKFVNDPDNHDAVSYKSRSQLITLGQDLRPSADLLLTTFEYITHKRYCTKNIRCGFHKETPVQVERELYYVLQNFEELTSKISKSDKIQIMLEYRKRLYYQNQEIAGCLVVDSEEVFNVLIKDEIQRMHDRLIKTWELIDSKVASSIIEQNEGIWQKLYHASAYPAQYGLSLLFHILRDKCPVLEERTGQMCEAVAYMEANPIINPASNLHAKVQSQMSPKPQGKPAKDIPNTGGHSFEL